MLRLRLMLAACLSCLPLLVTAAPTPESVATQLRDAALAGHDSAYSWVSELTTRFGPRPAGSDSEQRAAEWAAGRLKALGFDNVHIERFPLTAWMRGSESAELAAPTRQPLVIAALGESPPTPAAGLEGDVAVFATFEDLKSAPAASLTGKIAMVSQRMVGSGWRRVPRGCGHASMAPGRPRGAARSPSSCARWAPTATASRIPAPRVT